MTKEERRAKFLRPKKHQLQSGNGNRPGSFKRQSKELCFGCRRRGHQLARSVVIHAG